MNKQRAYWLDHPENVTKLYRGLWLAGIILVLLDLAVHRHENVDAATTFGFYAGYGFFACVALVLMAKVIRVALKRPEDYYER